MGVVVSYIVVVFVNRKWSVCVDDWPDEFAIIAGNVQLIWQPEKLKLSM